MHHEDPLGDFLTGFPEPAWSTDGDGVVRAWNPAAARVFGVEEQDALGRRAVEVVGTTACPGTVGEHPRPTGLPMTVRRPDGSALRGTLTTWAAAHGRHHVLRLATSTASSVARRPLEELLEHVSDSIITIDADGVVLSLNGAAERMWGVTQDIVGQPVQRTSLNPEPVAEAYLTEMEAALRAGRPWRGVELQCTTLSGRALTAESSATPLVDADGHYAGAVLVARDTTPVRELEQSLRAATRALRDRATQLVQATHRDPLTGVAARSLLQERLASELTSAVESQEPLSVLVADLDGFRAVNDSYGLAAGDALLIAFAAHLRSQLPPSATAGRLGADEFAVVLPRTSAQRAERIAAGIAAWVPPAPLPSRGRRADDEPVGATVAVVQASVEECRSSFDTGVRAVLLRAEAVVSELKGERRAGRRVAAVPPQLPRPA